MRTTKSIGLYGFTLIEIIVVTGIIMLLTGGAMTGYSTYNSTQRLKQVAKTFMTDLRFAQSKAVNGQTSKCGASNSLVGYRIIIYDNAYGLYALCTGGSGSPILDKLVSTTTAIGLTPVTSFDFMSMTGSISAPKAIKFTQTGTGLCVEVTISTSGIISTTSASGCIQV